MNTEIQQHSPRVILYVDDMPEIRIVVSQGLAQHGYRVLTAMDAESTFHAIAENSLDLIIIDYKLIAMDGIELGTHILKRLKTKPRLVLFTGADDKELAQRALAAGFSQFWSKPLSVHSLRKKVDAIFQAT